MKQVTIGNPSRTQVLEWINSSIDPVYHVKKIEQLGNGAAYLALIARFRPGSIKQDRIIKNPTGHHDYFQNLKLLSNTLEKLHINFRIQPDKLAQMKYTQNFYLASNLYKTLKMDIQNKSDNPPPQTLEKPPKIKVIVPEKRTPPPFQKEAPQFVPVKAIEQPETQSARKLKDIQEAIFQQKPNAEKLSKIASILHVGNRTDKAQMTSTKKAELQREKTQEKPSFSLQASYKRFLRPSVCENSAYLSNQNPTIAHKIQTLKPVSVSPVMQKGLNLMRSIQVNEFDSEMLLSQKKEESVKKIENANLSTEVVLSEFPHNNAEQEKMEIQQANMSLSPAL